MASLGDAWKVGSGLIFIGILTKIEVNGDGAALFPVSRRMHK
jgi:hypothetical protein